MKASGKLNFNHLYYAHKIIEFGSIKSAAQALDMSQSTLSEHLSDLEKSLGKKIFTRSKKRLSLTPEGQSLHRYTHLIFKTAEKIKFHFGGKKTDKHSIDVAVLSSIINSRTSKFLCPLFMDNKIYVKIHQGDSQHLIKNFINGELDILLTDYKLELPSVNGLESIFLESMKYVLVYNPKHEKIKSIYEKNQDLLPYLQYSISSEAKWLAEDFFSKKSLNLDVLGECDDAVLAKSIILQTTSCGMLPLSLVKPELEDGTLKLLDENSVSQSSLYANYINGVELEIILGAIENLKKGFNSK